MIPPVCSALLDCRTVEGETEEMLRGQLTLLFLESRQNSQTTFQLETLLCAPVGTSSRESSCCRTAVQALGGGQTVGCFNGSTDMPIFTEMDIGIRLSAVQEVWSWRIRLMSTWRRNRSEKRWAFTRTFWCLPEKGENQNKICTK